MVKDDPSDHLDRAAVNDAAIDALLRADVAEIANGATPLPPELRARVVLAVERARRGAVAPALRPSVWDMALRAAAVAAVVATTLWISPAAANAAESVLNVRPTMWAPVEFPTLDGARDVLNISPTTDLDLGAHALPLAVAAGVLLASGLLLRRR